MTPVTHRSLAGIVAVALVLGAGFGWGLGASEQPPTAVKAALPVSSDSFAQIVESVGPAVINVNTVTRGLAGRTPVEEFFGEEFMRRFFGDQPERDYRQRGLGSGVIIDPSGLALTNAHVIDRATEIEVVMADGKKLKAKVVGVDPKTDLAVLRLEGSGPFPAVKLGDSSRMQVGDWVLAMGSPFGLHKTVSAGIISGKGRVIGQGPYDDFLQTDAAINPGNSGGPLVNMSGEVIGINTAILSRSGGSIGIGFAIPTNVAQDVYRELVATGKVTRGWLGVTIQPLTPELAKGFGLNEPKGVLIAEVAKDSPAEKAGLRSGDIILEFDGKKVDDARQLQRAVAQADPGKTAPVKVWRDKTETSLSAKLGEMPEERVAAGGKPTLGKTAQEKLGLEVRPLTPDVARQFNVRGGNGVVVVAVEPDGPAASTGVRRGDVILEANRESIRTLSEFERVVKGVKPGELVTLLIQRGGQNLYVAFEAGPSTG